MKTYGTARPKGPPPLLKMLSHAPPPNPPPPLFPADWLVIELEVDSTAVVPRRGQRPTRGDGGCLIASAKPGIAIAAMSINLANYTREKHNILDVQPIIPNNN